MPHANTTVANSTSHGTRCEKIDDGVFSSSSPPSAPPTTLIANNARNDSLPAPCTMFRLAHPVVTWPGNSATVDVMFAASGDIPDRISAGSVTNEPPPASAFCRPAHRPARMRRASIGAGGAKVAGSHAGGGHARWSLDGNAGWPARKSGQARGFGRAGRGRRGGRRGLRHAAMPSCRYRANAPTRQRANAPTRFGRAHPSGCAAGSCAAASPSTSG